LDGFASSEAFPLNNNKITINSNLIHYRTLIVTGVTGGSNSAYRTWLKLLASKKVDLMEVISTGFPLSKDYEAFRMARSGDTMKVMLKPDG
jgi:threonine dehydrogenase-like Zn-dependent dehydrogenase